LNDIVVNKRLSASLVSAAAANEGLDDQAWEAFAAGRLYGREEGRFSSVMNAATWLIGIRQCETVLGLGRRRERS
jgi:hypothetical protein